MVQISSGVICHDESLGEKISVTIIATGFDRSEQAAPKKVVVSIDDDEPSVTKNDVFDILDVNSGPNANTVEFDNLNVKYTKSNEDPYIKNAETESPKAEPIRREVRRVVRRVRREEDKPQSKPLDNPRDITEMEDVPAYKRRKVILDDPGQKQVEEMSKLSINIDATEGPVIQKNNSYFHNNVD